MKENNVLKYMLIQINFSKSLPLNKLRQFKLIYTKFDSILYIVWVNE